jgi:hypothetical protein
LKLIGLVFLIAIIWAIAWGALGLGIAVLATTISPDTGHVPHGLFAFIWASVSTLTGFFSGVVYALVSRTRSLTSRRRAGVGAVVGAAGIVALLSIGAISNTSVANPLVSNLARAAVPILIYGPIAAAFGGLLAAFDSKFGPWPRD